jgi:ATP-dependent Zn protease
MTLAVDLNNILYEIERWLPVLTVVFLGLLVFLMFRTLSVMPKTKPKEIKASKRKSGVTWDDIAGVEGTRAELQVVVDFLSDPKRF